MTKRSEPIPFNPMNPQHVECVQAAIPDMNAIWDSQFEIPSFQNAVTRVMFRAGMFAMRELILIRVKRWNGSPWIETSIREIWPESNPAGWESFEDPGKPRRYNFDEVAVENERGGYDSIKPSINREAALQAVLALLSMGIDIEKD